MGTPQEVAQDGVGELCGPHAAALACLTHGLIDRGMIRNAVQKTDLVESDLQDLSEIGGQPREGKRNRGGELEVQSGLPAENSEGQLPHEVGVRGPEPVGAIGQSRRCPLPPLENLPQDSDRGGASRRHSASGHENFAGNVRIPRANSAPPTSRRPERCAPVRMTACPCPAATSARSSSSQRVPGSRLVSGPKSTPWIFTLSLPRNV